MGLEWTCSSGAGLVGLLVVATCTAWLSSECARWWRGSDARDRRLLAAGLVLLVGGLAAWIALVPPTYLHSNLHGPALVDAAVCRSTQRKGEFGPFGFVVQLAFLRMLGPGLAALAAVHAVFGALSLLALGLAMRVITRSTAAAVAALACGVAWPPLLRLMRSEDMHNVGALLACVELAGLVVFAREGRRLPAWVAVIAGSLLAFTRQTYVPWIGMATVIALLPSRLSPRRYWGTLLGVALMIGVAVARTVQSAMHPADAISVKLIFQLMRDTEVWTSILKYHPWFDWHGGAAILLPLSIIGAVALARSDATGRLYVLGTLGYLAVTLPSGVPTPGDNLGFRMPVFHLAVGLAGVGLSVALARVEPRDARGWLQPAVLAAIVALELMVPGRSQHFQVSPLVAEERFLQANAGALDASSVLHLFHGKLRYVPSYYGPARSTWSGPELQVSADGPADARSFAGRRHYFFQGLSCFMYAVAEVKSWTQPELRKARTPVPEPEQLESLRTIAMAAYRMRLPAGTHIPSGMRPECERLVRHGRRVGPAMFLPRPADELPFSVYTGDVELALYELDPSLLDEPPVAVPPAPGATQP